MTLAELIPLAIKASIVLLVFALGLQASHRDATYLLRHPGLLVRSILAMNVIMLVLAVAVAALFDLHPAIKIALVALAVSPVPPFLPIKQAKAGGTHAYTIGLFAAAAVVAIVLVPAAIELVGIIFGRDAHAPIGRVAPIVLVSVIAPLAIGIAVRHLAPAFAERIAKPVLLFAALLLVVAVLPVLVTAWPQLKAMVGNGTLVALALFTLVGIAVGHWLGGPDPDDRTVLALATGTRHPGVALVVAGAAVPDEKGILAVLLWHLIVGVVVSIPYVNWRKRSHAAA